MRLRVVMTPTSICQILFFFPPSFSSIPDYLCPASFQRHQAGCGGGGSSAVISSAGHPLPIFHPHSESVVHGFPPPRSQIRLRACTYTHLPTSCFTSHLLFLTRETHCAPPPFPPFLRPSSCCAASSSWVSSCPVVCGRTSDSFRRERMTNHATLCVRLPSQLGTASRNVCISSAQIRTCLPPVVTSRA